MKRIIFSLILFFHFLKNILSQPYSRPKIFTKESTENITRNHSFGKLHRTKRQNQVLTNHYVSKIYTDSNLNYYYTTLYIGKNKSAQTYILDTGSTIMTSPCTTCIKCGKHTNPYYKHLSSKKALSSKSTKCSFLANNNKKRRGIFNSFHNYCTFNISYSDGSSIAGYYTRQRVYFQNLLNKDNNYSKPFIIPIGCTSEEKKIFYYQKADGIMGLGNSKKSFVNMLYRTDTIRLNLFTLCFDKSGGYFALGRVDRTYHKSKTIRFVPILNKHSYDIKIIQILIGNNAIYNDYNASIDTGNTITYFPRMFYRKILNSFKKHCKIKNKNYTCGKFKTYEKSGYCASFDSLKKAKNALKYWPNITLLLDGFLYKWHPSDYHYEFKNENIIYICLGFNFDNSQKITLGTNFIINYDVIFDRYHQKIGFVRSDCSRTIKTYIFENTSHLYDFQRPKPIKINIVNTTSNSSNEEDEEETILDEIDDGRKKKPDSSEFIISSIVIVGIIIIVILIFCKSSKNGKIVKKNLLGPVDVEATSLQKEKNEIITNNLQYKENNTGQNNCDKISHENNNNDQIQSNGSNES